MDETMKALYDSFYIPLPMHDIQREVEDAHRQLIQKLDKPERKLILRIIDAKDHAAEERSIDSFICGFELAWKLSYELSSYDKSHPAGKGESFLK